MAINVDTQDLVNYPGNVKRVTVDQKSIVPQGYEGDEQYMLSFSTTAYSDNVNRTRIQDYYTTYFNAGWCKSSGFAGSSGNFLLDAAHCKLEVKMDATVSGVDSGYYGVTLHHESGIPMSGEVIAANMEEAIRGIADTLNTADAGFKLAYMNSSVEFKNGKFWIVSGSLSQYYSGSNKSSVSVRPSTTGSDASENLGFNLSMTTEILDGVSVKEALILTDFMGEAIVSGTGYITINQNIGAVLNDCLMITSSSGSDYLQLNSTPAGGTVLEFDAYKVTKNYHTGAAKVQLLREQDPGASPMLWFDNIDKITRHGVKSIVNQLAYDE